jgi:16S rRNA (cytosine1402-N4)-methyltransferase
MAKFHEPVLTREILELLQIKKGKKYLDATLGGAGHSKEILDRGGKILGIDADPEALAFSRKRLVSACPPSAFSWKLAQGNFVHLKKIARKEGFLRVSGILFDLGTSFYQLKGAKRGFSFDEDSALDMRLDPGSPVRAADLVNSLSQKELSRLFRELGEERFARKISQAICEERAQEPIKTSRELARIISKSVPRDSSRIHPATRCFQALRIAVNNELENLKSALPQTIDLLEKGGRLVVVSFHSLEDRIVKNFLKEKEKASIFKILTKKPITPSVLEKKANPSSRSAKLRAAEKAF